MECPSRDDAGRLALSSERDFFAQSQSTETLPRQQSLTETLLDACFHRRWSFCSWLLERWGWAVFNGLCHEGCKNTRPGVLQFRSILISGDTVTQMRQRPISEPRREEGKMTSSIPIDIDARLLKERE